MASKSAVVDQLLCEGTHTARDIMRLAGCTIGFVYQRANACNVMPAREPKPLHPKHAKIEAAVSRAEHTYCEIAAQLEVSSTTVKKCAARLGVELPTPDGKRAAAETAIKAGGKSLAQIGRELGISNSAMSRHASRVQNPPAAKLPKELPPNLDDKWLTDNEARSIFGHTRSTLKKFREIGIPALDGRKLKHKELIRDVRGAYGSISKRRVTVSSRQMLQENADALANPIQPDLQSVTSLARELKTSESVVRNHIKKGTLSPRHVVTPGKGPARKTFVERNGNGRVPDPRKPNRFKSIEPTLWTEQGVERVCFPEAAKIIGMSVGKVYEWHRGSKPGLLARRRRLGRRDSRQRASLPKPQTGARCPQATRRSQTQGLEGRHAPRRHSRIMTEPRGSW